MGFLETGIIIAGLYIVAVVGIKLIGKEKVLEWVNR